MPAPAYAGGAVDQRGARRGGAGRALRTLLLVLVLAIIAVALYFALFASGGGVELRDVSGDDAGQTIQNMKELIDENTR
jgi:hypothetical protein